MLLITIAGSGVAGPGGSDLPVLTTARAAHKLNFTEAKRRYPVHLRGVVTEYNPYVDPKIGAFFVCDGTGCICVLVPPKPVLPVRAGIVVDVRGVSDPGNYAPIVIASEVHPVGQSALPEAPRRNLKQLLTGVDDGQWVEVEGVVHGVKVSVHSATLDVQLMDGLVRAVTQLEPDADYSRLIDAKVLIRANAAPVWNKNRQMVGARLLFPSLAELTVEEAPPKEPFSYPISPISGLRYFASDALFAHRVRIRGQVTLHWPGQFLFIQYGGHGLFVPTEQKDPVEPGRVLDAVGFPATGEYSLMLEDAIFRVSGERQDAVAVPVTAQEALNGAFDARLVRIRGQLVNQDLLSDNPMLALSSNGTFFLAGLPPGIDRRSIPAWRIGSEVEVAGICAVQVDKSLSSERGIALPKSFRILLRSARDVSIVRESSWWTAGRILVVLAVCVLLVLAGLLWVAALRRRVAERTETIRATLESTADAILVVDSNQRIVAHNRKFESIWSVPGQAIARLDHGGLIALIRPQLIRPDELTATVPSAGDDTLGQTDDVIELRDGRVFERHSEPQTVEGKSVGRVWGFRDVTELRAQTRLLEDLARIDSLTGLRNRRDIFELLSREIQSAERMCEPITVIMADLDRFKTINDRHGHVVGDTVLKEAAERFKAVLGRSAAAGRYGGEEFLIVVPECNNESARSLTEQLRCAIDTLPVLTGEGEIRMSCSFGVAIADRIYDMAQLLHAADLAMYKAKRAGGNCARVAEHAEPELAYAR